MSPASVPLLLLLCAATRVPVVLGLKCYVCVPQNDPNILDVLHIFPKFPANLTCETFTTNHRYIMDCPNNYTSCIMITDGSKVTRSCAEPPFSDCKMANDVEYCYCKDSLCNGARTARHPVPTTLTPLQPPSDDEDLEGSGGGPIDTHRSLATSTTTKQTPAATPRSAPTAAATRNTPLYRTVLLALLLTAATSAWAR